MFFNANNLTLLANNILDASNQSKASPLSYFDSRNESTFVIWFYAFISVIVISVCGLVPIICMPKLQKTKYQNDLLQFLIGLAIGTLTADALLHLLPISSHRQAHGVSAISATTQDHNHHHNDNNSNHQNQSSSGNLLAFNNNNRTDFHDDHDHKELHHNHTHPTDEGFWFGFMALSGIIGFLVLERIMVLLTDVFTKSNDQQHSSKSARSLSKTDSEHKQTNHNNNSTLNENIEAATPSTTMLPMTDPHLHMHHHQNHHQHQHHHLTSKTKSFMFMIITGDGLHNFFDGIAIGVSYASSLAVGLSTSIAILCHELPHEIGDFAVLIKSGMTIKRAILYNTLSSILCLLGATTGVFIGKIDVGWVSALIAGMFLYISLVDMVPQLDCYPAQPALKRVKKLLIQLSGIAAGVGIMSLIATYESRLHSLFT